MMKILLETVLNGRQIQKLVTLENGRRKPSQLKSPNYVLRHQVGTCFELSTLLVSLLIGNGYDAYVVFGFASKQCCENDQTFADCPSHLLRQFDEFFEIDIDSELEETPEVKEMETSKFWETMAERKQMAEECRMRAKQIELEEKKMQLERIPTDDQQGNRIHSWVLLIHEQDVHFVEPTTGRIYSVNDDRYIAIDSVWNHCNYWVNMRPSNSLKELSFDLTDLNFWEHLLVSEPWHVYGRNLTISDKRGINGLKHFQMPFSTFAELSVSEKQYEEKYPNGYKIVLYKCKKVEKFSPNRNKSRVVLRLTEFEDDFDKRRTVVELYHNRDDSLLKRKMNATNGNILMMFANRREDTLKKLEYSNEANPRWNGLKMEFYSVRRLDNISSMIFQFDKLKITFSTRTDKLSRYRVEFKTGELVDTIEKMRDKIQLLVQIFDELHTIDRIFYRIDGIKVQYRYQADEIYQNEKFYSKNNHVEGISKVEKHISSQRIGSKSCKVEFEELQIMQKQCLTHVQNVLSEVHKIFEACVRKI